MKLTLKENNIECLQDVISEYVGQTADIPDNIKMNSITNKVISENCGVIRGYMQRFVSYNGDHKITIDNSIPDGYIELEVY